MLCASPPVVGVVNDSFTEVNVELTINGQLTDLTHSGLTFQYYAQASSVPGPGVRIFSLHSVIAALVY